MAEITGTPSNDVLFGTPGDDLIDGGAGDDGMNGGVGNDTYLVRNVGDEVYEAPDQGIDTAIVYADYILPTHVENLNLTIGIYGYGNRGDNLIQANDADNLLSGFKGSDVIYGFKGNDVIAGNAGNDRLYGGSGNDTLYAGKGYDELYGGEGNDTYIVDSYNFTIFERLGKSSDTIEIPLDYELKDPKIENLVLLKNARFGTGNRGDNSVTGNDSNNALSGLQGNDRLAGGSGNDTLYGNQGNDILRGGEGTDELYGQTGNDRLVGDRGNDTLVGEAGNDILIGYGGSRGERDRLMGGDGADLFGLGDLNKGNYYLGSGYAAIVDFRRTQQDKIQVSDKIKNYRLVKQNTLGSSAPDTAIYKGRDLIAVVQDTTAISIRDLMVAR